MPTSCPVARERHNGAARLREYYRSSPWSCCESQPASRSSRGLPTRTIGVLEPGAHTLAGQAFEIPAGSSVGPDSSPGLRITIGLRQRMLGELFEHLPRDAAVILGFADRAFTAMTRDLWPAFGQRAGLVEHHDIDLLAALQRLAVLDQMPRRAPRPVPTMMAVGVAKSERAGTGDHQHGYGRNEALLAVASDRYQPTAVTTAMQSTIGTKMPDTRSASFWIGALLPCASATSLTI